MRTRDVIVAISAPACAFFMRQEQLCLPYKEGTSGGMTLYNQGLSRVLNAACVSLNLDGMDTSFIDLARCVQRNGHAHLPLIVTIVLELTRVPARRASTVT